MAVRYLFLFLFLAPAVLFAAEPVQRPAYRLNTFWQFQVSHKEWINYDSAALHPGVYELDLTPGKLTVFELVDGAKVEIRRSAEGELRGMLGPFKAAWAFLEFPLFEGKSWKTEYTNARKHSVFTDNLVTGTTRVTTPAGAFEALKIERDDRDFRSVRTREYYYVVQCACIALYSIEAKSAPTFWPPEYYGKREITLIKFGFLN